MELTPLTTCPTTILDGDASLGSHTPPLTHDYGTGIISTPTVAPSDTVPDVTLTTATQFVVSELDSGVSDTPVDGAFFYGTSWTVNQGSSGHAYRAVESYTLESGSSFIGDNVQVVLGDGASVGHMSDTSITAGAGGLVKGRNDTLTTGDGGTAVMDTLTIEAGDGCLQVRAFEAQVFGGDASRVTGIMVECEVFGATGTTLGIHSQASGGAYAASAFFEGGPVLFSEIAEPPNPSTFDFAGVANNTPAASVYSYNNSGTSELRTNVNGNIVVLAVG